MKIISSLLAVGLLALAGCGADDSGDQSAKDGAATETNDAAAMREEPARQDDPKPAGSAKGTTITLGNSEFGSMLFGSDRQAIYIFQNDSEDKSVCYGECADAWPPVFTKGEPRAGKGVNQSLLGTMRRRDGKRQVTYAGKPLYFYAHEGPGEVRCHNVNLNGGLWWVVGPDGNRRA